MKIYAYVKSQNCLPGPTLLPGSEVGRDPQTPVSHCGDYVAWTFGKRATLAMFDDPGLGGWHLRSALAVRRLLQWGENWEGKR